MQNQVILTPESSHGWNLDMASVGHKSARGFCAAFRTLWTARRETPDSWVKASVTCRAPASGPPAGPFEGRKFPPGRVFRTPIRRQKPRENWPFGSAISDQTLVGFPLWG